jgi:hypothetical protein
MQADFKLRCIVWPDKKLRVIVRNLFRYTVEVETISSIVAGKMVDLVYLKDGL